MRFPNKLHLLPALYLVLITGTATCAPSVQVDEKVRAAIHQNSQALVLVKLKAPSLSKSATPEERLRQIQQLQNAVLSVLHAQDFQLRYRYQTVPGFSGLLFASGLQKLANHPEVESIKLDVGGQGGLFESVPAIKADVAHHLGFTGEGVIVGVLDSGVDFNHPDLRQDIVYQYHFLSQGANIGLGAQDQNGHGTNVTGIITSDGAIAPIGVAPKAKIVAIQVLDQTNSGWVSDWIAGVDHLVANNATLKVKIINMSLVTFALYGGSNCDNNESLFAAAVDAAKNSGITVFACSGNNGSATTMTAPGCLSGCTAVGAVYDSNLGREPDTGTYRTLFGVMWPDCDDATSSLEALACFTNRTAKLELVAPGALITSTGIGGGISTYRGTSQASPHAAGVAALMLQKNPFLTPENIVGIMKNSSVKVSDPVTGKSFPLLNAMEALDQITNVTSSEPLPGVFTLEQNFPNPFGAAKPFNATTVIKYSLPQPEVVTLTIFDLVGREVKRLAQAYQSAGAHQIAFDGKGLTPGLYFYLLKAGTLSQTRKMVIL